jgi:hypothetical protein
MYASQIWTLGIYNISLFYFTLLYYLLIKKNIFAKKKIYLGLLSLFQGLLCF